MSEVVQSGYKSFRIRSRRGLGFSTNDDPRENIFLIRFIKFIKDIYIRNRKLLADILIRILHDVNK